MSLWLSGKESACNAGDMGLIPGSGRSPGKGNGNPLNYSSLGNPIGRGSCWATPLVVSEESDTTLYINNSQKPLYIIFLFDMKIYLSPKITTYIKISDFGQECQGNWWKNYLFDKLCWDNWISIYRWLKLNCLTHIINRY